MKRAVIIWFALLGGIASAQAGASANIVYRDIARSHGHSRGEAAFEAAANNCYAQTGEAADAPAYRQCMLGQGYKAQFARSAGTVSTRAARPVRTAAARAARPANESCFFLSLLFGCDSSSVAPSSASVRNAGAPGAPAASDNTSNDIPSPTYSSNDSSSSDMAAQMAAANSEAATNQAVNAAQDANIAAQAAATLTETQANNSPPPM